MWGWLVRVKDLVDFNFSTREYQQAERVKPSFEAKSTRILTVEYNEIVDEDEFYRGVLKTSQSIYEDTNRH